MTEVDLLNQALAYLGEARVQSLTQDTTSARDGAEALRPSVEQVLRLHPWNSAQKRARLSRLTQENEIGLRYNYQLPSNYLKLVCNNREADDFSIEGNRFTTDATGVELVYIAYPTDFGLIDSNLFEAIAAKLAFNISLRVTGDYGIQDRTMALYEKYLARARTMDARESGAKSASLYEKTMEESEMIKIRRRVGTGIRRRVRVSNERRIVEVNESVVINDNLVDNDW